MTDIEQLEKNAQWLEDYSKDMMDEGLCDQTAQKILDISNNIRAHAEAMKQKPIGYLNYEKSDIENGIKPRYEFSRHALTEADKEAGFGEIKIYTSPPPPEQPLLKVPVFDEMYYLDALEQIIAMNVHLKVEEVK